MSESIKASLWDLASVDACLQSMEREAQQLDAAKQGLTGRAWMLLSYRAGVLTHVAKSVRERMGRTPAITDQFSMRRYLLADIAWHQHPWDSARLVEMERKGHWHHAFATRCAKVAREEVVSCLLVAAFNQFRSPAQQATHPEALAS